MEKKKILVAPSILAADFGRLAEEIKAIEKAGADWVHVDVMDGHFVPNITIGPTVVKHLRKVTDLFFDVHLMIDDPAKYIDRFADAGSDMIVFHVETCDNHIEECERCNAIIDKIRARGKKAGVSIKPGTPLSALEGVLDKVDMVLIMTVEPGFGGQSFMEDMLPKVTELKKKFKGLVEVDGGITPETAPKAIRAGVDVLVAGTAVFKQDDYGRVIRELKGE